MELTIHSLTKSYLESVSLPHRLIRDIRLIGEYSGRETVYRNQTPQQLHKLREIAVVQSAESSNRIEGVVAPPDRIRNVLKLSGTPRNRSEREIVGYRDALNTIHTNHASIELREDFIRQLHRLLFSYATTGSGGTYKASDNVIEQRGADGFTQVRFRPVPAAETEAAMHRLHERFHRMWDEEPVDRLILIAAYVLDFLCIHPFRDGNGRLARLLTLLLLYNTGIEVGRYISLERLVEQTRESYYDTLYESSQNWHQGRHDLIPWLDYFFGILLRAYRLLEERVDQLRAGKGAKTAMVLDAITSSLGDFSVSELLERCPTVGVDLIRKILRGEQQAGRVECMGRGPFARWRRVHEQ